MELEFYNRPTYNKLVHSATTRSTVVGVIHKLTVDEFVDRTNEQLGLLVRRLILHMVNRYTKFGL